MIPELRAHRLADLAWLEAERLILEGLDHAAAHEYAQIATVGLGGIVAVLLGRLLEGLLAGLDLLGDLGDLGERVSVLLLDVLLFHVRGRLGYRNQDMPRLDKVSRADRMAIGLFQILFNQGIGLPDRALGGRKRRARIA